MPFQACKQVVQRGRSQGGLQAGTLNPQQGCRVGVRAGQWPGTCMGPETSHPRTTSERQGVFQHPTLGTVATEEWEQHCKGNRYQINKIEPKMNTQPRKEFC